MTNVRELEPADADELTTLYDEYEWWEERTSEDVRTALEHTDVAVGIESDGRLVAAARVLTDHTFYATVYDVIVAADRRGDGVGRELMEAIQDHEELQSAPGLSLLCRRGLIPFYRSVGFELFDPKTEIPEGGQEEVVRMVYKHN